MSGYLVSLLTRRAQIERHIEREMAQKKSSWLRLMRLKRIRLKIEERLHQLMFTAAPRAGAPLLAPVRVRNLRSLRHASACA